MEKFSSLRALGKLGQKIEGLMTRKADFTLFGVSGCGRSTILNLIYEISDDKDTLVVQTNGADLIDESGPVFLAKKMHRTYSLGGVEDLYNEIGKSDRVLILVHFFEFTRGNKRVLGLIQGLKRRFVDKVNFVISCDLSILNQDEPYLPSSVPYANLVLVDRLPDKLLLKECVNLHAKELTDETKQKILSDVGGNVGLCKYVSLYARDKAPDSPWNPMGDLRLKVKVREITEALKTLDSQTEFEVLVPPLVKQALSRPVQPENSLTANELKVYEYLKEHKGNYVTKEDLANVMWGNQNQDKYSEWAVYKMMNNLKNKLNNVATDKIRNVRGRGYIFS